MRLYINKKEVPTHISAIETYISIPQSTEAQNFISYLCIP